MTHLTRRNSFPMRWHCLQHVPFEGPAQLSAWVSSRRGVLTTTRLWESTDFPDHSDYDGLFILGGPMNVYEVNRYPWLASEQCFIAQAISLRKPILGLCLGAQLLAVVLGGTVDTMLEQEIGWYPVKLTRQGRASKICSGLPDQFMAFHWHGDTFSIPPGAVHLARSEACEAQAFAYDTHVVGLQFHLESTRESIHAIIRHCAEDLGCGPFIQDPTTLVDLPDVSPTPQTLLWHLLDGLSAGAELPTAKANN